MFSVSVFTVAVALVALARGNNGDGRHHLNSQRVRLSPTISHHESLTLDAARLGLKAEVAGRSLQDVAKDFIAISKEGLKRRSALSGGLVDETGYLAPLEEIADSGMTPADRLLELYHGPWGGDVTKVYEAFSY